MGKRLTFLIQELTAKPTHWAPNPPTLDLTRIRVDMKVLIEQMREQVQNINERRSAEFFSLYARLLLETSMSWPPPAARANPTCVKALARFRLAHGIIPRCRIPPRSTWAGSAWPRYFVSKEDFDRMVDQRCLHRMGTCARQPLRHLKKAIEERIMPTGLTCVLGNRLPRRHPGQTTFPQRGADLHSAPQLGGIALAPRATWLKTRA